MILGWIYERMVNFFVEGLVLCCLFIVVVVVFFVLLLVVSIILVMFSLLDIMFSLELGDDYYSSIRGWFFGLK